MKETNLNQALISYCPIPPSRQVTNIICESFCCCFGFCFFAFLIRNWFISSQPTGTFTLFCRVKYYIVFEPKETVKIVKTAIMPGLVVHAFNSLRKQRQADICVLAQFGLCSKFQNSPG